VCFLGKRDPQLEIKKRPAGNEDGRDPSNVRRLEELGNERLFLNAITLRGA
jgi:hypothetical protein